MNKKVIICGLWCLLSILGALPLHALAHDGDGNRKHWGKDKFSERVAGTYLLRFERDDDEVFLRLVTLTEDGNWFSIDAHQQADRFGFTDQQGVWKRTGRREITVTVLDFDYDPFNGEPVGVARLGFVMEFTPNLQEVRGKFSGKLFGFDEDPLDPNIPLDEFGATFTGRRVNVIDGVGLR